MEENSFLWISNDKGLVYNTENGKHLSFVNSKKLAPLTERLNKIDNLYCIDIDDSLLYDVEIYTWIKDMIAIKAGNLTEVGAINYKPIQYYPKLNLQFEEGRKYKSSEYITENQNYNTYLHEVTVYINGDNNGNNLYKEIRKDYGKLFLLPKPKCVIIGASKVYAERRTQLWQRHRRSYYQKMNFTSSRPPMERCWK